jgi:hypothetical protein
VGHTELYVNSSLLVWLVGPVLAVVLLSFPPTRPCARFVFAVVVGLGVILALILIAPPWPLEGEDVFAVAFFGLPGLIVNLGMLAIARRFVGATTTWRARTGFTLSIALGSLSFVGWSFANAGIVATRARAIAGDSSFCLQVGEGFDYRSVTHWDELLGHRMRTPFSPGGSDDYQWTFHAVLVVPAVDLYNWSYWAQNFVPVRSVGLRVPVSCKPTTDFLESLT